MEENGNIDPWKYLRSVEMVAMVSSSETISLLSLNHPLFSCIITLYILILLYFPQSFSLKIVSSPVLVLTASLLLSLLRLGAIQRIQTQTKTKTKTKEKSCSQLFVAEAEKKTDLSEEEEEEELKWDTCKTEPEPNILQSFEETFVEWNVGAPLEVIYEAYEGEEEEESRNDYGLSNLNPCRVIERYPSLSLYYPESDSDSSSSETDFPAIGEWVSSEKMCYRWEEEDREGLIEIALDKRDLDFHGEEENLIEIDISSVKS